MEMLTVVAIIGVLAAVAIPALSGQLERARQAACLANRRSLHGELAAEVTLDGYSTLQQAWEKMDSSERGRYTCPDGGSITVSGNDIRCSVHSDNSMGGMMSIVGSLTSKYGIPAIREFYGKNGNSLPTLSADSALWKTLLNGKNLPGGITALYWRPSLTLDGRNYVLFASPAPYDDSAPQANWQGFLCYYDGVYYVSTRVNSYTKKMDPSGVANIRGSVSAWLTANGWSAAS